MDKIKLVKGQIRIPWVIRNDWMIKVPTIRHRLHKSGTVSLVWAENIELRTKAGIVLIDMTKKAYVMVPKEILCQYEKTFAPYQGRKSALVIYKIGEIVKTHGIELIKLEVEE